MKLFNNKKNKSIDCLIHSSILDDQKDLFVKNIIQPSLKSQPDWWRRLKVYMIKELGEEQKLNVKTCPAFIELFKNSYIIKSPCEWMFEAKPGEYWKFLTSNNNLAQAEDHNLDIQMNSFSKGSLYNFKLKLPMRIKSSASSGVLKLVYTQPYYHNYKLPLTVMPGVMPLVENIDVNLSINYSYNNKEHIKFKCNKGDVLAYLYCTEKKIPDINIVRSENSNSSEWFINKFNSSYINNLNENQ